MTHKIILPIRSNIISTNSFCISVRLWETGKIKSEMEKQFFSCHFCDLNLRNNSTNFIRTDQKFTWRWYERKVLLNFLRVNSRDILIENTFNIRISDKLKKYWYYLNDIQSQSNAFYVLAVAVVIASLVSADGKRQLIERALNFTPRKENNIPVE